MTKRVLILTPSLGLGELIQQVLAETGGYSGEHIYSEEKAQRIAIDEPILLTVLDAEWGVKQLPGVVESLRLQSPEMRLIVIPMEDDPDNSQISELVPDHILPSPFYLPDLINAVEDLFEPSSAKALSEKRSSQDIPPRPSPEMTKSDAPAPNWLMDVTQAAQYLTRLSLESASQAALITRGEQIWAYAGELPHAAAEELAGALAQNWESESGTDFARFVHLSSTQADYMLYATTLGGEFALALVFDAEMPFSRMRAQASELAQALTNAPEEVLAEARHEPGSQEAQTIQLRGEDKTSFDKREFSDHDGEETFKPQLPRAEWPGVHRERKDESTFVPEERRSEMGKASPSGLIYSFVLVPRLPTHQLEGDLAHRVEEWLPQLCVAFAWRLDNLTVQPRFLHWTISASVETAPETVTNTIQRHLSERIFEEFPRLTRENPSGEFWAQSVLILNGARPSAKEISDFIQQTRARQGLPPTE